MDVAAALRPGRDFTIALASSMLAGAAIFSAPGPTFPVLHTVLNTGLALVTVVVSLLLWDLGWRTGDALLRHLALVFAVAGVLEILHVLAALEPTSASATLNEVARSLRSGTWAPPAYLLPLGIGITAWLAGRLRVSWTTYCLIAIGAAFALFVLFQWLPRYREVGFLGILRPTLVPIPLLWMPVALWFWRRRRDDPVAHALAYYALGTALSHALMLFSSHATSNFAMTAHFGVFAFGLCLLLSLVQMGTRESVRRKRVEQELKENNEALEDRVRLRTRELESLNADLRREVGVRHEAEVRTLMQLERLELLRRITRAIAERQELDDIFKVVVDTVEEHLPADLAVSCLHERDTARLVVNRLGPRNQPLAATLRIAPGEYIAADDDGLARCLEGELVCEPDITRSESAFFQRLVGGGLHAAACVPIVDEQRGGVFAVLILARRAGNPFSGPECEFLRQLCDQVALAANQAQLHASLQQAYEHLQRTREEAAEQERLRVLGQMASGIAHDINNAMSPVSLYVEAILEQERGLSERARGQLQIVQRAVDDVARTVARMGEFSRRRPARLALAPVPVARVLGEVLELTRARWSDMAQQRGVVIETRIDCAPGTTVMAIESELREALVNLVLNGVDAMPEGGRLTLRGGSAGEGAHRKGVFIEVSDTGVGMDEDTRRRCLEPFFTTKGERGTGLGLAMVYGIAQRHGMDIDIRSAPGVGTTFRLTFVDPGSNAAANAAGPPLQ